MHENAGFMYAKLRDSTKELLMIDFGRVMYELVFNV